MKEDRPPLGDITRLLLDWKNGNQSALNHLFPLVYDMLRALAHLRPDALEEGPSGESLAHETRLTEVLAVDELLAKLDPIEPRLVDIVEMRYFAGLSVEETEESLGLSARTVKRDRQNARGLLLLELQRRPS